MNYTRNDIDKLAAECIGIHKRGPNLLDAILSVLKQTSMNPEQTKRLVESTNTNMFLDKFKGTSGDNRFVDFDILDPSTVLSKFLGGSSPGVKTTSKSLMVTITSTPQGTVIKKEISGSPEHGLDTEDSMFFDDVASEKTAYYQPPSMIPIDVGIAYVPMEKTARATPQQELPFNRWKAEEYLRTKIADAEYTCDDLATELAGRFNNMYAQEEHANFEKEALANFGPVAVYALQAVRQKLAMQPFTRVPDAQEVKTASDHYVSDRTTDGMGEVAYYLTTLQSFQKHSNALSSFVKESASFGDALATYAVSNLVSPAVKVFAEPMAYQYLDKYGPSAYYQAQVPKLIAADAAKTVVPRIEMLVDKGISELKERRDASDWKNQRKTTLSRMLKNNPDISGADPELVMQAVNETGRWAPYLSAKSEPFMSGMVSAMLQGSLSGGGIRVDPETINAMTKADLRARNLLEQQGGGGNVWAQ